ncbi:MAG: hypothetical protein RL754_30 [Bacteroidota bacterium]
MNVLGLMSGTSLDGMDAAFVRFEGGNSVAWELLWCRTFDYPTTLKRKVERVFHEPENGALQKEIDLEFAQWTVRVVGECVQEIERVGLPKVELVGTHGQTIFHQPQRKMTFQAGCLPLIAKEVDLPVVCDFRTQDVLLGGQGAPLVPFGDHVLFGHYEAALNLGGFANVSLGRPTLGEGVASAFDIVPVNIVMNEWAEKLGFPYDHGGEFARSGAIDLKALDALNALDFYTLDGPKSMGNEWVQDNIRPILSSLAPTNALATMAQHCAHQIGRVLRGKQVLTTGGGALNAYLMELVRAEGVVVNVAEKELVEYKEAIIFALLAWKRFEGQINVLGATTGSGQNHSSGKIFRPE